jgi:hypothetical protein
VAGWRGMEIPAMDAVEFAAQWPPTIQLPWKAGHS